MTTPTHQPTDREKALDVLDRGIEEICSYACDKRLPKQNMRRLIRATCNVIECSVKAALTAQEWKSIDTAPQNTWVLISDGGEIDFAMLDTQICHAPVWIDYSSDVAEQIPTYWMPLPKPPVVKD